MSEKRQIVGEVYVAPLAAMVPTGCDAPLSNSYSKVGSVEDVSLYSSKLFELGDPYVRLIFPYDELDINKIHKGSAIWVLDLILPSGSPRRVVLPHCRPVSLLVLDCNTDEVTLQPVKDKCGCYRYDYTKEQEDD